MVRNHEDGKGRLTMIVLFGLFGILGTYTGVIVSGDYVVTNQWFTSVGAEDHAIANSRNVSMVMAGLLGGPLVGLGAGLIAGAHRYFLGGFTALACAVAAVLGGWLAGLFRNKLQGIERVPPFLTFFIGMGVETIQMLVILILAKPFDEAVNLVEQIGAPMILFNGLGIWIFVLIIQSVLREEERTRALQTQKALFIADQTLPFFRQGLAIQSSRKAAEVIRRLTGADAIAITDRSKVLAHVGEGCDHHIALQPVSTEVTKKVLETGQIAVAHSKPEINCPHPACPLQAAVVLPLVVHGEIRGTLKLYFTDARRLSMVEKELAEGLAKLFCTQLELGEAERQSKLLKDAEIKALQAQIHPHFLFNAINSIVALCRTDVALARKSLVNLATFFRNNLQGARQWLVPVSTEMEHVEAYLSLEQVRFPGRYSLQWHIAERVEHALIPPFTLQPLVENAIKHGLKRRRSGGAIEISLKRDNAYLQVEVADNGCGIAAEQLKLLGMKEVASKTGSGTALQNLRERLTGLFGAEASMNIESGETGTRVRLTFPYIERGEDVFAESVYRRGRAAGEG
jgi:two-component system sensor histidine kinase LytS